MGLSQALAIAMSGLRATQASISLVGSNVANNGIINSPQGDVILAAGQSVKIFDTSTPGVRSSSTTICAGATVM